MMLNEMMLFEDLLYLELSTQRPQDVMAIMEEVGKNYKADPRFKKYTFLEPLYEESNQTSIEVVRPLFSQPQWEKMSLDCFKEKACAFLNHLK